MEEEKSHVEPSNLSFKTESPRDQNDTLPGKNENYKDVVYWDQRYMTEDSYEWCKDYGVIKDLIEKYVKKTDSILMLGCGNSNLSIDLYNDGFTNITNVDYSTVVIEKQKAKYGHLMKYLVMDVRELEFHEKFDIVIEKSTLDVFYTKESTPWTISDDTKMDIEKIMTGIKNVLMKSSDVETKCDSNRGKFISISFAEPFFRKKVYSQYWGNINVESFGDFFHYYFYIAH